MNRLAYTYAVRYRAGQTWHEKAGFVTLTSAQAFIAKSTAHTWTFYRVQDDGSWKPVLCTGNEPAAR